MKRRLRSGRAGSFVFGVPTLHFMRPTVAALEEPSLSSPREVSYQGRVARFKEWPFGELALGSPAATAPALVRSVVWLGTCVRGPLLGAIGRELLLLFAVRGSKSSPLF